MRGTREQTGVVTTEGQNRLGLWELCERNVNDQWFAAHASQELAAEALLECADIDPDGRP